MSNDKWNIDLVDALSRCGFSRSMIKFDYKIWIGSNCPCKVDLALLASDKKTLLAAFEIKHKIVGTSVLECARKIYRICNGGIPCFIVEISGDIGKIAEVPALGISTSDLKWIPLSDDKSIRNLFLPLHEAQIKVDGPIENVEDYLRAVNRVILKMQHLHGGKIENHCVKFMFRGHSDATYELCPSLFRNLKKGRECPKDIGKESFWSEEQYLLNEAARTFPDLFRECRTCIECMAVAQHYEIPTRLLDVTGNALVGLYFAVQCNTEAETAADGMVYVFKVSVGEYREALQNGTVDLLGRRQHCTKGRRGRISFKTTPRLVFPSFLTERQKAQDGAFYVIGDDGKSRIEFKKDNYETISIPMNCKDAIRDELELRCNVHKGTMFPDSLTSYKDKFMREAADRICNCKHN